MKLTWPQICTTQQFKGMWVALDNCRYNELTMKPVEGDVVDSDEELSALCSRMRESGQWSCAILFCDGEVLMETPTPPSQRAPALSRPASH